MFLYHYFSSLVASVLIGSFLLFQLVPALENPPLNDEDKKEPKLNPYLYLILLALAIAAFILFSPLSYGFRPFLA